MAQSIYTTLETLSVETSVPEVKDKDGKVTRKNHGSVKHTLPRSNYPDVETFDNVELFVTWAKERNALLPLLQHGIKDYVVDDRAIFKAIPPKSSTKEWSEEYGQKNVDNREWKVAVKPNSKGAKAVEQAKLDVGLGMAQVMQRANVDDKIILASLIPVYGENGAATIMLQLTVNE